MSANGHHDTGQGQRPVRSLLDVEPIERSIDRTETKDTIQTEEPAAYVIGGGPLAQQRGQKIPVEERTATTHETDDYTSTTSSSAYVDVDTVDAHVTGTHSDGHQSTHQEAKARDALDKLATDVESGVNPSTYQGTEVREPATHQEAKARNALDALATDVNSGSIQSTPQDVHVRSTKQTTVPGDRVLLTEPTLTEKAAAVVDQKTEEVLAKIHGVSQGLQQEINERTQGLQKELNPDSHELAHHNSTIGGAVTQHQTAGVLEGRAITDIGWHKDPALIPDPLIRGYHNGEVFSYIRRFNKDVFDVRSVPMEVTSGLDLNEVSKLEARAKAARVWLRDLASKAESDGDVHIVVTSHGGYIHFFTNDWDGMNPSKGTGWENTEYRSYEFADPSGQDPDATIRETSPSWRRRRGSEVPLTEQEQMELRSVEAERLQKELDEVDAAQKQKAV